MSLKKECKKPVSVLTTFTSVIETREETIEIAETTEAIETTRVGKDGKENKGGKYLGNFI